MPPLKPPRLLDDGYLDIRGSVTAQPDETYAEALADTVWEALDELARQKFEPHHLSFSCTWERDEPGRESSRRVFVIAIAEPRQTR
jgi:hypothetical protein